MSQPLKIIFRFILFLLVQAMVLNHMPPLHRFITPYIYFLFIIWMPFSTSRVALLFGGFALGICLDFFTQTPGLHAAASLTVAFFRPLLVNLLVPKDTRELTMGSPSISSMGFSSYFLFAALLTFFHHFWLVLLEWMTFANFVFFLEKVVSSTLISLLLIIITELIFRPVQKKKGW